VTTLLNFNPNVKTKITINSPRSLKACENQGCDPQSLKRLSKDQIKQLLRQNQRPYDDESIRMYGDHLEQRRKAKLEILLKVSYATI
jgi:hypothetical protein